MQDVLVTRARVLALLMRPQNTRASLLLFVCIGAFFGLAVSRLVLGTVLIILAYGSVTIYNDFADLLIDRMNERSMPLAVGSIGRNDARMMMAICVIGAIAIVFALKNLSAVGFLFCYFAIGWSYSNPWVDIKSRGILASACLAVCYAALPMYLAIGLGNGAIIRYWDILLASAWCAVAGLLYKDFKDEAGDRYYGKKTPLVRYGQASVRKLSVVFAGLGAAYLCLVTPLIWLAGLVPASIAIFKLYTQSLPSPLYVQLYNYSMLTIVLGAIIYRQTAGVL